jgi:LAS superfamily LD-carboxypeptidase LdcB
VNRRSFYVALLALPLVLALAWAGPSRVATVPVAANTGPPLPRCTYADDLTRFRAYGDWQRTLVDTQFRVSTSYAPGDLVSTSKAGLNGGYYVRKLVIADLKAMASAARAAGARLQIVSGYRSYRQQKATFYHWVSLSGYKSALLASARPGHSEHQLGTTLDFTSHGGMLPWRYTDWGKTSAGAWMRSNAWRYGFVMSYPKTVSPSLTCYKYEPWHFRYVGRTHAKAIRDARMTLREYLWYMLGNNGFVPTPSPEPTPDPTPAPSDDATAAPPGEPSPEPTAEPSASSEPAPSAAPALPLPSTPDPGGG